MKMEVTGERGMKITAENPDEKMKTHVRQRIVDALYEEFVQFTEEVSVALRNLEPGKTTTLSSKPIKITISRESDEKAKTKAEGRPQ